MIRTRAAALLGASLAWMTTSMTTGAAADEPACRNESPCLLDLPDQGERRYYVDLPPDADGSEPLPVIVWYHGYRGNGLAGIRNRGMVEAWTDAGWIFVSADGVEGQWSHQGLRRTEPDDTAYSAAIIEDIARYQPIDRSSLLAAGFSSGGFMVWTLACFGGAPFTHFAPVSGAFWEPLPEDCNGEPVVMRHTHGTADATVPLEGRWLGGNRYKQGDVFESLAVMRETDGCRPAPDLDDLSVPPSVCRVWRSCEGGRLELCLHDGGHMVPRGWSGSTQTWVAETRAE